MPFYIIVLPFVPIININLKGATAPRMQRREIDTGCAVFDIKHLMRYIGTFGAHFAVGGSRHFVLFKQLDILDRKANIKTASADETKNINKR